MVLAPDQVRRARPVVLENAASLLDDALYLYNDGRYARAYALTVLAREEMAKLAMLVRVSYGQTPTPAAWKRLESRMRSHRSKLELFALVQILTSTDISGESNRNGAITALLQKPENRQKLEEGKQDGFYVTIEADSIRSPLPYTAVDEVLTRSLFHDTKVQFQFYKTGEAADPATSSIGPIKDPYGLIICLAEDFIASPQSVFGPS